MLLPRAHYAMLGIVIDDPAENLNGYQGDAPQVVWDGLPVALDVK